MTFDRLQRMVADFTTDRAWENFHTPKNLVMALTGEVGELSELFQWLTAEQSQVIMETPSQRARVEDEVADILIYLLRLADVLEIDLGDVVEAKVQKNADRYPVSKVYGRAVKYTEIDSE
ncbi:nucleotide pyrophosphohydrolase [Nocardia sp. NPDC057663]|uniref:nucleotide pyrophosphohydrolase n=1 Tax=Nocardia sp. NPDC057663 TaxID=3346201 RepID=UPI00366B57F1